MPPKKAPIYCLVNGDPENSVFGIKYDKNTTVDELKEIIYTKKKNAFADIDYPDLTLYKVLRPMDNIEEKFPTPANGHIHIIVDVPAVPATIARRNDDVIIARLDKLDKNIEDIKREKSSTKILEFTGLDYQSTTREIEFPTLDLNLEYERIAAFGWTDAIERSQNDRYTPHLKNILKLDTFRTLGLYDPTGDDSFLSTNTDILQIRLSGTTDLVIVDRHSIASQAQEKHIRFLFELKKVVKRIHTFQAMAELISTDLKSKYPVLAVLTDLMDDWRFFWIQGKIIMRLTLSREESVALIRRNLVLANNEMRELANQGSSEMDMESSFFEEEPLPRRQKLRHVVATSNRSEKARNEVIFAYYYFGEELEKRLAHYRKTNEEHEAKKKLYDAVKDQLPKEVTKSAVRKKADRAGKVYDLFFRISDDKTQRLLFIQRIKSISATSISKLSDDDIKYVASQVRKNTRQN
uniref:Crinkler effector protein N-terminal domain-containing protein n=1 Tax=Rhizophagus irregularis (strain DAOM 181602 / DAOM 197198 / MUCL 43194) TaxID=747089 RepID=U9SKI1_RHIID